MVDTPVRVFFWKYVAAHSNEYMVQGFSVLWWCSERVKKFIPENVCHSMHSCHMTDDHRSILLYWYWYVLVLIVDVVFTYLHRLYIWCVVSGRILHVCTHAPAHKAASWTWSVVTDDRPLAAARWCWMILACSVTRTTSLVRAWVDRPLRSSGSRCRRLSREERMGHSASLRRQFCR